MKREQNSSKALLVLVICPLIIALRCVNYRTDSGKVFIYNKYTAITELILFIGCL